MRPKAFSTSRTLAFWSIFIFSCYVESRLPFAPSTTPSMPLYDYKSRHFENFIENIEQLVVNTTERALLVTRNVYLQLNRTMPETLRHATQTLLTTYIEQVNVALQRNVSYIDKRKLFQNFRATNRHIQQLRKQLAPQVPEFQFQLISDHFYNDGRNATEFDNLYLEFMQKFAHESRQLWANLQEQTVEEQEELLEIIDEIDSEQQLRQKDKLYDEFIEMFLFKPKIENRELD